MPPELPSGDKPPLPHLEDRFQKETKRFVESLHAARDRFSQYLKIFKKLPDAKKRVETARLLMKFNIEDTKKAVSLAEREYTPGLDSSRSESSQAIAAEIIANFNSATYELVESGDSVSDILANAEILKRELSAMISDLEQLNTAPKQ